MSGFQTNVLRDGDWVTTTVSAQEVIDATAKIDAAKALPQTQAPRCGVLTRTVVPSPVAHWVLPIRIRSKSRIDVAFVGSHAVQISELRRDGQLLDVARKDDFGSRICNAVVMGDTPNTPEDIIGGDQTSIKIEDAVASSGSLPPAGSATQRRVLPPQILVLFLENGLLLFIFMSSESESAWNFEMMHYQTPWAIKNLGFRFAIDPTSRYLAAASSQKAFAIWELETRDNIELQYEKNGVFSPLKPSEKPGETVNVVRSFQGTLFHLEFLFPRPEDVDHIILMMVVARRDCHGGPVASRVLTFDWIAGENLGATIEGDGNGIRLPEHYSMPLMIIPLRFKNSLCVVSEHSIGVIKNAISGSMTCDDLMTERPPRTPLHYGHSEPLWAAWARPIRGDWYCKNTDIIMLAREDGYLVHIEVDAANVVPSVTSAGCLDSTISTGFAMPYIDDADAIIVSGDSSPGGTWKLSPRDDPVRASILRNWSPVVEITAAPFVAPAATSLATSSRAPWPDAQVLVSASGRETKGNLALFRWGRQARIGCDIDTESTIRQVSAFIPPYGDSRLLHVALSLPEATLILQFSNDLTEVRALGDEETPLDLESRTIILDNTTGQLVQVTERSIVLVKGDMSTRMMLQEQGISCAEHAVIASGHVILSSLASTGSAMHVYRIDPEGIKLRGEWHINGEVTCLGAIPQHARLSHNLVIGTLVEGHPWLSFFDLDGRLLSSQAVAPEGPPSTQHALSDNALYEGFTSLHVLSMSEDTVTMILGTLWGRIIYVDVSVATGEIGIVRTRRLGKSAARLFPLTADEVGRDLVVTCDDNLMLLSNYDIMTRRHKGDPRIIPMSDDDAASQLPPVQWVAAAPKELQIGSNLTPLLLLTGSRLLIAELSGNTSLVPRSIPTGGTPTKVLYSDMWKCYIVATTQRGRPTLHFVDPSTGSAISQPTNTKTSREPTEYASGLGLEGDRVLCMEEWAFIKDDKVFPYLLVGLQSGTLLTISARSEDRRTETGATRQIQYWTRHKRKVNPNEPVYAVLGVADGYVHCTGNTVYFDILETQEKKLKEVSHYPLDSPAVALQVRDEKLFVLTSRHSLLVLDHRAPRHSHPVDQMPLLHADGATRSTIHMLPLKVPSAQHPGESITMLSDASGNVVGVWTALGKRDQPLETVFRAALPVPIRRFIQGRCRAPWYESKELSRFGAVQGTDDGKDTFGVSLDGALYHFTVLTEELWQMLRFIQAHAERTPGLAPAGCLRKIAQPEEEERRRHIDGDLMARCLQAKGLEEMMALEEVRTNLFKLLDNIEGGSLTRDFKDISEGGEEYFALAYRILEYLDTPVL